jgi:DNA-binding transcriptional ArsR family regulator
MSDLPPGGDLDEVFGAVADETRIAILRALWEAHTAAPEELDGPEATPVPFSELRERVGVADSGRFNYHLDQLVPEFVHDREEGYALTHAGAQVVGAAVSGVYGGPEADLDTTVGACTKAGCEGTLTATYADGHVTVACGTCDVETVMHVPPVVVEAHDIGTDPEALQRYTLAEVRRLVRGFCGLCSGPVEARVSEADLAGERDGPVTVVHVCQACGSVSHTSAALFVLDHPAVVSLLHGAGIDYRSIPLWAAPAALDREERVAGVDPVRVDVRVTVDGETLVARLDGNLDVIEVTRGDDEGGSGG